MRSTCTRTLLFTLVALCAAAGAADGRQAAPAPNWRVFDSQAGRFSIKFPGEPKVSQLPMVKGPLNLTRHVHALTAGDYEFEMDYVDMPAGYDEPELALEGGISGITRSFESEGGRVLSRGKVVRGTCEGLDVTLVAIKWNLAALGLDLGEPRKLSVGTYPGRDYILKNERAGMRGRLQTYSTPRRAYIFIALARGQTPHDKDIERFFSSVRVSPK